MIGRLALFGLLLGGLGAACDRPTARGRDVAPRELPCTARDCSDLPSMEVPEKFPGGEWVATSSWGQPCRIEVAWPIGEGGAVAFHETILVEVGDVFPLHGHVAEVDQCQDMRPRGNGGMFPPMGTLGIDALSQAWAAPRPESVVVLMRGEAALDGIVAQAAVRAADAGAPPSADVSVGDASWQLVTVHRALHAGDTFPWGAYGATIVRIVPPDARFVGWLEVAVKSRDRSSAAAPPATASMARRDAK